ncbi:prolyl oligopeptidase family serine peptidase [Parachryseolinea silvisoli]|uniref:prolyl oligopeptidase family serine peptidase n=1 Tax=Parachryseolinea silvisoli TaxID=2873601 RepID=UPI002265B2E7|nr:prolyl oligopeptidase family serine peptidase [Parachryseolinea silvisoli]MCD9016483.1 prolyl oligopeptidase family serine peptidase [Parachryseolinea silvisoli]
MKTFIIPIAACLAFSITACTPGKEEHTDSMKYPQTRKVDTVDTYFETAVADPYRWLENDTARETGEWVEAQNEVTASYLSKIPYRDAIKSRLREVYNYERLGTPFRKGDYLYFAKNDGLQNQNVYYRKKGENGAAEVFLDPNTFSADGTTKLAGLSYTNDGSRLVYLVSRSGSDWNDAIVIDAVSKRVLEDTLHDLKFASIAWKGNDSFYYTAYDKPEGSKLLAKAENQKLYYHRVGTPRSEDVLIFGDDKNPKRYLDALVTEDERFLVIVATNGTSGQELYIKDLNDAGSKIVTLVGDQDNDHSFVENVGSKLYIQTNYKAPNNRLVIADISAPSKEHWKDLIPETKDVAAFSSIGGKLFAEYTADVKSLIKQFDLNGKFEHDVALPGIGAAGWGGGKKDAKEVFYSFTSFLYPTTIFRYDIAGGKSTLYAQPKVNFNADDYEMKQVFYTSKDGTKVPMFIVHKRGLTLDGKNATLLYGYGGFNISLTPVFYPSLLVWLENGGVYALPNIRGGGEYGETWHKAGTKLQKQNVFDDFIAAAEYLIKEKYTSADHLAIKGGSNGGLLVGACMTQRPDLFKVALPGVGVMDMLRYHQFSAGPGWAPDYGMASDSKEMFDYLRGYSPLHNIKAGTRYPATMVNTADHDDRVVPAHSFKFAATLQEYHAGETPVLIRIDTKSAHGASNLSKAIDLDADQFAFSWYNMGVVPPLAKKDM